MTNKEMYWEVVRALQAEAKELIVAINKKAEICTNIENFDAKLSKMIVHDSLFTKRMGALSRAGHKAFNIKYDILYPAEEKLDEFIDKNWEWYIVQGTAETPKVGITAAERPAYDAVHRKNRNTLDKLIKDFEDAIADVREQLANTEVQFDESMFSAEDIEKLTGVKPVEPAKQIAAVEEEIVVQPQVVEEVKEEAAQTAAQRIAAKKAERAAKFQARMAAKKAAKQEEEKVVLTAKPQVAEEVAVKEEVVETVKETPVEKTFQIVEEAEEVVAPAEKKEDKKLSFFERFARFLTNTVSAAKKTVSQVIENVTKKAVDLKNLFLEKLKKLMTPKIA